MVKFLYQENRVFDYKEKIQICLGKIVKPKTSANNKKQNLSWRWIGLSCLTLKLSGCASDALKSNPVVVQTSNVAIAESSDASGFYLKLMNWREKVKVYLGNEMQD